MTFSVSDRLIEKDGELVARIERGTLADNTGSDVVRIKGSEIHNLYGTKLAEVKNGKILMASGLEFATVATARKSFGNSNHLSDIEIATAWLCLVKGIR